MENKFKVGDYVVANVKGNKLYSITDFAMKKGKVILVDREYIEVEIIEHVRKENIGDIYRVFSNYFDLYEFNISKLQFADIVTLRNGERYVVADNHLYGENDSHFCDCDDLDEYYNDDLTYKYENYTEYDIVKVERNEQVIYEREEATIEMTVSEIEKKLGVTGLKIKKEV